MEKQINTDDQSDKNKKNPIEHSSDYAPYPKLDQNDQVQEENLGKFIMGGGSESESKTKKKTIDSVSSTSDSNSLGNELMRDSSVPMADDYPLPATSLPPETNPYISASPVPSSSSSVKERMDSVRDALGRWSKRVGEATKKAEDLAGNVWQHLKTAPSVTDAAMGRIAQSTKVLAEGGYDKIFKQSFETVPDEQLQDSFACYLSTSAGPVMGTLYLSTAKIAFCSDTPLSYKVEERTEWSYYKVVIPLHQLKAVNPSASKTNPAEKYIQVISVDGHEFWFMGFVNYDNGVHCLQEALRSHNLH